MAKGFFATLECDLIDRCRFRTQLEAHLAIFKFNDVRYIPPRRHSMIEYLSPANQEREYARESQEQNPEPIH